MVGTKPTSHGHQNEGVIIPGVKSNQWKHRHLKGLNPSIQKQIQSKLTKLRKNISKSKPSTPKKSTASEVHLLCLLSEVKGFFLYRCLCLFLHVINVELLLTPQLLERSNIQKKQRDGDWLFAEFWGGGKKHNTSA